jgi:NADPH-dependent 7-cyano-7-deazaguanine reductase QueF
VEVVDHEEEDVEEIYSQLWVILKPDKVRVPSPSLTRGGPGCLVWVRKDLLRENRV